MKLEEGHYGGDPVLEEPAVSADQRDPSLDSFKSTRGVEVISKPKSLYCVRATGIHVYPESGITQTAKFDLFSL